MLVSLISKFYFDISRIPITKKLTPSAPNESFGRIYWQYRPMFHDSFESQQNIKFEGIMEHVVGRVITQSLKVIVLIVENLSDESNLIGVRELGVSNLRCIWAKKSSIIRCWHCWTHVRDPKIWKLKAFRPSQLCLKAWFCIRQIDIIFCIFNYYQHEDFNLKTFHEVLYN